MFCVGWPLHPKCTPAHACISFCAGLKHLQTVVNNRTDQMRQLVSEHLQQFLLCKETVDAIHERLSQELITDDNRANKARAPKLESSLTAIQVFLPCVWCSVNLLGNLTSPVL